MMLPLLLAVVVNIYDSVVVVEETGAAWVIGPTAPIEITIPQQTTYYGERGKHVLQWEGGLCDTVFINRIRKPKPEGH
jgi:hypothetical protein